MTERVAAGKQVELLGQRLVYQIRRYGGEDDNYLLAGRSRILSEHTDQK